jgi:hypothetical protein
MEKPGLSLDPTMGNFRGIHPNFIGSLIERVELGRRLQAGAASQTRFIPRLTIGRYRVHGHSLVPQSLLELLEIQGERVAIHGDDVPKPHTLVLVRLPWLPLPVAPF